MRQKAAGSRDALQQRLEVLKAENIGGGCSLGAGKGVGQGRPSPHHPHTTPCTLPTDASDLQGRQLLAGLDKVASDLDRQEKAITGVLRPPLEQSRAVQDSTERAEALQVAGPGVLS